MLNFTLMVVDPSVQPLSRTTSPIDTRIDSPPLRSRSSTEGSSNVSVTEAHDDKCEQLLMMNHTLLIHSMRERRRDEDDSGRDGHVS